MQHLRIPSWLIPYIHREVKYLFSGSGDVGRVLEGRHPRTGHAAWLSLLTLKR